MKSPDEFADDLNRSELERKVAELRRDRDAKSEALRNMSGELADAQRLLDFVGAVGELVPSPPKWVAPPKRKAGNHAIAYAPGSDWHLDEVVNPDEMNGVNAFDRDIAGKRLQRYYEKLVTMSRDHLAGLTWDGIVHPLNGDIFSGDIHDELVDTNADALLSSILYWLEPVAAGIDMLADNYGKVHVPVTPGNHGRRSRKSRMKGRAKDNFDWMFGHLLAREFKGDDRVSFQIPESFDVHYDIYDTTIRQEHGDAFKGGSGIAGIWSPIARGHARRAGVANATDRPFDVLSIGHFHQLIFGPQWIINGSLKGYDEYAAVSGFGFEEAAQAFAVVTPEHGVTWRGPVLVQDRKSEKW
jgi:hypothetical protein